MSNIETSFLLVDGVLGKYAPKEFADNLAWLFDDINPEDLASLSNPESEDYEPSMDRIVESAKRVDSNGIEWTLYRDGEGIYELALYEMSPEDHMNFFGEEY